MSTSEKKLIGVFYFEKTNSGNLIGEFSNNSASIIMTEGAIMKNPHQDYQGEYETTWFDGTLCKAELKIASKGEKFELSWIQSNKEKYKGEGFLTKGQLIGWYESV